MVIKLGGSLHYADLGPGAPVKRPAYSVGGRLVSDPLAVGIRIPAGGLSIAHGLGAERPSVWLKMRGGPTG